MDVKKYMEAAVEREIALVNYDKVTVEHLEEHSLIEDSKNLELFQDLLRAFNAQLQYMTGLTDACVNLEDSAQQTLSWATEESARITMASSVATASADTDDMKRLVEHHEHFVRCVGGANLVVAHALFKTTEPSVSGNVEALLARALDIWGLSENLWMELFAKHSPEEMLPYFHGNKTCERLLNGFVQVQFVGWYEACLAPLVRAVVADPTSYTIGRAEGVSALLTLIERSIDKMEQETAKTFPPLFALLCQHVSGVPSLIGGNVIRFVLRYSELVGGQRVVEPGARTALDVAAFILWICLTGKEFVAIDPTRAAFLKLSVSVTHCVSEYQAMLNDWLSSSGARGLTQMLLDAMRDVGAPAVGTFQDRLDSIREGGCVAQLLQQTRSRLDTIGETLALTDRGAAFRLSDAIAKASVAVAVMEPVGRLADDGDDFEDALVATEEFGTSPPSKNASQGKMPPPRPPAIKRAISNPHLANPGPPPAKPARKSFVFSSLFLIRFKQVRHHLQRPPNKPWFPLLPCLRGLNEMRPTNNLRCCFFAEVLKKLT